MVKLPGQLLKKWTKIVFIICHKHRSILCIFKCNFIFPVQNLDNFKIFYMDRSDSKKMDKISKFLTKMDVTGFLKGFGITVYGKTFCELKLILLMKTKFVYRKYIIKITWTIYLYIGLYKLNTITIKLYYLLYDLNS